MLKQAHVYIKGDVIGVGFRAWTKIQAKIIGLSGWVKNEHYKPDIFGKNGGVEAVFQGEDKKVNKILEKVKEGPPVSYVKDIEVFFEEVKEIHEGFDIVK